MLRKGLVVYRVWGLKEGQLCSQSRPYLWRRYGNMARCEPSTKSVSPCEGGNVPNAACQSDYGCGLWGFTKPEQALRRISEWQNRQVIGITLAWDHIIRLKDGCIRAAWMDVWAFASVPYLYPSQRDAPYLAEAEHTRDALEVPYAELWDKVDVVPWLVNMAQMLDSEP